MPSKEKSSSRSSSSSKKKKKKSESSESEDKKKDSKRSSSSSKKSRKKEEHSDKKKVTPSNSIENSAPSNDPSSQNIQSNQNLVTAQQNYDIHKLNFMTTLNINNHVYDKQLTELQFIINSKLIPTKQSLLSQLYKIQSKMTMVKKAKDKLLNEYKIQMETLFNNLNMQESNKMLILKQDETSVLNQLQTIQNFVNRVGNELSSGKENIPVATDISSFNDISSFIGEANYLSDKHLPLSVDNPSVMTTLLEYEQGDMKDLSFYKHNYEELKKLLHMKNQMITKLMIEKEEERKTQQEEIKRIQELYMSTKNELHEWMKMVEK